MQTKLRLLDGRYLKKVKYDWPAKAKHAYELWHANTIDLNDKFMNERFPWEFEKLPKNNQTTWLCIAQLRDKKLTNPELLNADIK